MTAISLEAYSDLRILFRGTAESWALDALGRLLAIPSAGKCSDEGLRLEQGLDAAIYMRWASPHDCLSGDVIGEVARVALDAFVSGPGMITRPPSLITLLRQHAWGTHGTARIAREVLTRDRYSWVGAAPKEAVCQFFREMQADVGMRTWAVHAFMITDTTGFADPEIRALWTPLIAAEEKEGAILAKHLEPQLSDAEFETMMQRGLALAMSSVEPDALWGVEVLMAGNRSAQPIRQLAAVQAQLTLAENTGLSQRMRINALARLLTVLDRVMVSGLRVDVFPICTRIHALTQEPGLFIGQATLLNAAYRITGKNL